MTDTTCQICECHMPGALMGNDKGNVMCKKCSLFYTGIPRTEVSLSGIITDPVAEPLTQDLHQPEAYTHKTVKLLQDMIVMGGALEHERQRLEITLFEKNQDVKFYKGDQRMLEDNVLRYGNHEEDCAYYEELDSGRITGAEECSCGWTDMKKQLEQRLAARSSEE